MNALTNLDRIETQSMEATLEEAPLRPRLVRRRGPRLPPLTFGSCAVGFGLLFCLFNITEGVNRWILSEQRLEAFVYLRDVFLVLAAACGMIQMYMKRSNKALRLAIVLMGVALAWAYLGHRYHHSWAQSAFGLKTYLPLFAGLLVSRAFFESRTARGFLWLLWMLAVFGVFLSAFVDLPWKGNSYFIGDDQIEGQREWSVSGVDRLAGFSRGSTEAAVQIGVMCIVLMRFSRRLSVRAGLFVVSAGAMILTTSRGPIIGFAAATITLWMCTSPWSRPLRSVLMPIPLLPAFIVLLCMFVPNLADVIGKSGSSGILATQSFEARGDAIWKDAWDMQIHKGSVVLGRGIGGIGSAQKVFEPMIYNPADNFFVYIVVTFGAAGALIITLLSMLYWGVNLLHSPEESALGLACAAFLFGTGVTLSSMEIAFLLFMVAANWMPPPGRKKLPRLLMALPEEEEPRRERVKALI